jgi:hypothetical protein
MCANLRVWHDVVAMVADVYLTNQRDRFVWGLHQNGLFLVNSMYRALLGAEAILYNTLIWKLKLSLKIKVFMWYLYKGVILTKDNLARRQWQGDRKCCLCSSKSPYNIYSLTIIMLNSCRELFMFPLI